jgi:hypothetical protein
MVGGCCLNLTTPCISGQSDLYRKHKRQQSKYTHRMELHQSWCIQLRAPPAATQHFLYSKYVNMQLAKLVLLMQQTNP